MSDKTCPDCGVSVARTLSGGESQYKCLQCGNKFHPNTPALDADADSESGPDRSIVGRIIDRLGGR